MNCTNTQQFIEKAALKHANKYDYSKSCYINTKTKIEIICPLHGAFLQRPSHHLYGKEGCKQCDTLRKIYIYSRTIGDFIKESQRTHGDKYNYTQVNYINSKTKVKIICKERFV